MENYNMIKDITLLLQRVDELEKRLEDIEDQEFPSILNTKPKCVTMKNEIATLNNSDIREIKTSYGTNIQWDMIHVSSTIVVHSNGAFDTTTVLKDNSGHRKYGNTINFVLRYKDTDHELLQFSTFSGNFSPGEEKTYPTTGVSDDIKNNFELIERGELYISYDWTCGKR